MTKADKYETGELMLGTFRTLKESSYERCGGHGINTAHIGYREFENLGFIESDGSLAITYSWLQGKLERLALQADLFLRARKLGINVKEDYKLMVPLEMERLTEHVNNLNSLLEKIKDKNGKTNNFC